MFDQASAKRFLIDRIVRESRDRGAPLTTAEEFMLTWSESDPAFTVNESLVAEFERDSCEDVFERKISTLLWNAYRRDVIATPDVVTMYRQARDTLSQGDHYLSVMIDARVGSVSSRYEYGPNVRVALLHALSIVFPGMILSVISIDGAIRSQGLYEGVAFVFVATFLAALAARLLGASTLREAWACQPGAIGGTLPASVIGAVVSAVTAVVLFGLR
jgi:hypothetical protein